MHWLAGTCDRNNGVRLSAIVHLTSTFHRPGHPNVCYDSIYGAQTIVMPVCFVLVFRRQARLLIYSHLHLENKTKGFSAA